jgi:hypothetical protein
MITKAKRYRLTEVSGSGELISQTDFLHETNMIMFWSYKSHYYLKNHADIRNYHGIFEKRGAKNKWIEYIPNLK